MSTMATHKKALYQVCDALFSDPKRVTKPIREEVTLHWFPCSELGDHVTYPIP
jgi:hypothetical protein